MTGRRARAPHDPTAAQTWFATLAALYVLAAVLLGMALGVLLEAWGPTWRVFAFALAAGVCAEGGVVASARFMRAVDGPSADDEPAADERLSGCRLRRRGRRRP